MKVARRSFLGVLLGILVLAMVLALHAQAAPRVSSTPAATPVADITEKVVNADGGIYWRSDPDWSTPITIVRQGVYTGDTIRLACYQQGSTVPPYNNNLLWYWGEVIAGYGQGSGWVNDHFLNTGTNQPNIPVNGVIPCPDYPYIWSHTSAGANIGQSPGDSPAIAYVDNGTPLILDCWVTGGWMEGDYRTNRWFHGGINLESPEGYINASFIANTSSLPDCNSLLSPTLSPTPMPTPVSTPAVSPTLPPVPTPTPTPTSPPMPPAPTPTPTSPPSHPIDAYSNYGPANTGYPICRGNLNNPESMPGGTVSQTFTVPAGVASLNSALVQIDPDSTVTAHMSLAVNGNVVATADAVAVGDTQFWFGPVYVSAGDVITLSISFTATYGKIITVYTAGAPGGTFTTSNSCPAGASNVSITSTGLRARVSGMS